MQIAIVFTVMLVLAVGIFLAVRWKVRHTPHLRTRMILAGAGVTVLGIACGVWLPRLVPNTPGSPGATVVEVILWLTGGGLLFLGVPALLAAALTQAEPSEPPKVDQPG